MSGIVEELAQLGRSLGNLNQVKAARARLEILARRISPDGYELTKEELKAVAAQTEVLARIIFELNRAVSARVRDLGGENSHAGQS